MWDQFQLLLHVPLKKISNAFDNDNRSDDDDDDIEKGWLKVMSVLSISNWDINDTKHILRSKDSLLLLLDGFDEIANEVNKKPGLKQWLQHCTANENSNYF
ncbi:hypothetical protein RFI_37342, partial [Reticulomyxa filosa]